MSVKAESWEELGAFKGLRDFKGQSPFKGLRTEIRECPEGAANEQ